MARIPMPKLNGLQWTLLALIVLCLLAWAAMLVPWLSAPDMRITQSMHDGQYVRILVENGEIQGKPEAPKKDEKKNDHAKDDAAAPAPVKIEEPKKEEVKQETTPESAPTQEHSEQATGQSDAAAIKPEDAPQPDATPKDAAATTTPAAATDTHTEASTAQPDAPPADAAAPAVTPVTATPSAVASTSAPAAHTTTPAAPTVHELAQGEPLNIAKNKELEEAYNGKVLPMVGKDGTKPSQYYSRPSEAPRDVPVIALAVSGLGLHEGLTKQAINDLPSEVSLSFTPYAKALDSWVAQANNLGHEAWLDVPMEYADYPANDPGPLGLLKGATEPENITRLKNTLSSATGYVGVIAPKDEIFTGYSMMQAMSNEVQRRGLLLLLRSRAFKSDNDAGGVLYSSRSLMKERMRAESLQSLQELETIAKDYGYAIGVLDASPALFSIVQEWAKGLETRKIELVPLSAIPHRRK